jgi:hypothetical protein
LSSGPTDNLLFINFFPPVNPITQEVEIRGIMVKGQPGQKIRENPSKSISLGVVGYTCDPSYGKK